MITVSRNYTYDMGLAIDGVPIPDPKGYKGAKADLDTVGKRNAQGNLVRNMVATKSNVTIEYENIDWEMMKFIAQQTAGKDKFDFSFLDPFSGTVRTIVAYTGDREWDAKWLPSDGQYWVGDLKFKIIEI